MTHPLTPREKVAEIVRNAFIPYLPEPFSGAKWQDEIDAATDRILTALASSPPSHPELALMANAALEIYSDDVLVVGGTRRIHADNIILYVKNGVDALLAENAALRAERDGWIRWADEKICEAQTEATEAERKLAEADRLNDRAAELMRQCTDPERFEGASTLNVYANMRAWLSDLPPAPGAEDYV